MENNNKKIWEPDHVNIPSEDALDEQTDAGSLEESSILYQSASDHSTGIPDSEGTNDFTDFNEDDDTRYGAADFEEPLPVYSQSHNEDSGFKNTHETATSSAAPTKQGSKVKRALHKTAAFLLIFSMSGGVFFGSGYATADYFNSRQSIQTASIDTSDALGDEAGDVMQINQVTTAYTASDDNTVSAPVLISEEVGPAVVTVISTYDVSGNGFYGNGSATQEGSGSGVIFDADSKYLYIVTNQHVIAGAAKVEINLITGDTFETTVLGYDSNNDIAVLAVDITTIDQAIMDRIAIATFGDSDALKPGELAVAIGSPLGKEFSNSVTVGVISALDRVIDETNENLTLIQTDAAINPGNSGGALVNANGEIIGINSAKYVDTDVEGMGFAIPINYAKPIIESIIENGDGSDLAYALTDDKPFLGVGIQDITEEIYQETGMPFGVYINKIYPGSGAEAAGLQVGDIIFALGDQKILNTSDLLTAISSYTVGDILEITVARDGKMITLQAELYAYGNVVTE